MKKMKALSGVFWKIVLSCWAGHIGVGSMIASILLYKGTQGLPRLSIQIHPLYISTLVGKTGAIRMGAKASPASARSLSLSRYLSLSLSISLSLSLSMDDRGSTLKRRVAQFQDTTNHIEGSQHAKQNKKQKTRYSSNTPAPPQPAATT